MNETRNRHPINEKSIILSDTEFARLRRLFAINSTLKNTIVDLLIDAQTKILDRQESVFDELSQRFGFQNTQEVTAAGKSVEISWATKQVNLLASAPDPKQQIAKEREDPTHGAESGSGRATEEGQADAGAV